MRMLLHIKRLPFGTAGPLVTVVVLSSCWREINCTYKPFKENYHAIRKQFRWSAVIATVLAVLTSCSNDTETQTDKSNTDHSSAIAALRQATGLAGTTISIPKNPGTAARNADGSYNMTDFLIDMDAVKKTIINEKVTYSFSIMPRIVTSVSDYNLIVYNNGSGWEYSIMELVREHPEDEKFTGSMKELYSSTARGSGCVTIFTESHHCTRTGPCAGGTCDGCSLCVDYDSFTLCRHAAEQYLTATFVENPDYGGGGGGVHTGPQHIDTSTGGFIFEPNIRDLDEIRRARAAAFFNALSATQQEWVEAHGESYQSLLDYYLNHYSPAEELYTLEIIDSFIQSDSEYSGDGFMGDNDEDNEDYDGPKENIPHNIILNDNTVVTVTFGSTESDNESADKPVAPDLVACVKQALNEANENLGANNKITSIYIKATSNGSHGPNSNHSKGTALDLSRINGNKIANLGNNIQVQALQQGFDSYPNIRENFGPTFKHKTYTDGSKDLEFDIAGHSDHIHVSVQSN
jgi:hypothetical protein